MTPQTATMGCRVHSIGDIDRSAGTRCDPFAGGMKDDRQNESAKASARARAPRHHLRGPQDLISYKHERNIGVGAISRRAVSASSIAAEDRVAQPEAGARCDGLEEPPSPCGDGLGCRRGGDFGRVRDRNDAPHNSWPLAASSRECTVMAQFVRRRPRAWSRSESKRGPSRGEAIARTEGGGFLHLVDWTKTLPAVRRTQEPSPG